MARFTLTHHVIRAGRDMTHEVTEHDSFEGAERAATVAAELTTIGQWRQEIVDDDSGERWLRTRGTAWVRYDGE